MKSIKQQQTSVSVDRINDFLNSDELDPQNVSHDPSGGKTFATSIEAERCHDVNSIKFLSCYFFIHQMRQ